MVTQIRLALLPTILLFNLVAFVKAANFTFSHGVPTECEDFSVTWTGGTGPFELALAPALGIPRTFQIPSSAYSDGKGTYTTQLPFDKGRQFMVIMSDSSGFGSGGFSPIQMVAQSSGNANCNTTDPNVDFFFSLDTALTQCRLYTFSNYERAVQPLTIYGIIPGGKSIQLTPPTGSTSYDWTADVAAGNYMMFIVSDSRGGQGGSSDFRTVGLSDDSTCLNANSPTSTTSTASTTSTGASQSASATSSSTSTPDPASKSNTGVIIGGVLAGLFGLAVIIVMGFFCFRRYQAGKRRDQRLDSIDLDSPSVAVTPAVVNPYPFSTPSSQLGVGSVSHSISPSQHNLLGGSHGYDTQSSIMTPYTPSAYSEGTRYTHQQQSSVSESGIFQPSASGSGSGSGSISGYGGGVPAPSSVSSSKRKAELAGIGNYKTPTRFIVHTDLEEAGPEEEAEVVELPPQYSERRAPLTGLNETAPPPATAQSAANYDTPPPFPPPTTHPLETDQGQSSARLQQPIEPGPPSPSSTRPPW